MTSRARFLSEPRTEGARVVAPEDSFARAAKRILRERVEARAEAVRLVEQARTDADALLERARVAAGIEATATIEAARRDADAQGVARWVAVRVAEERRLNRDADRIVTVAVALAERLLGAALELDPARIAAMARGVLAEARGARQALVDAHPVDANALRQHLHAAALGEASVEVRDDPRLGRGDLRLHTELGAIDARLEVRFERLGAALRDVLTERPSPMEPAADG